MFVLSSSRRPKRPVIRFLPPPPSIAKSIPRVWVVAGVAAVAILTQILQPLSILLQAHRIELIFPVHIKNHRCKIPTYRLFFVQSFTIAAVAPQQHRMLHTTRLIRTVHPLTTSTTLRHATHISSRTSVPSYAVRRLSQPRLFSSTIDRIMNDEMINNPNHHHHHGKNNTNSNNHIDNPRGGDTSAITGSNSENEQLSLANSNENSASFKNYTEYEIWVRRLYATNLFHPVKLGLENMIQLHKAIGNPMDHNACVVHIAGTNGKGSVALKIAKTLQYTGCKVGLFCSPHVSSFRERMQINDQLINEEEVVQLLPHIYDLCKLHDIPATFFEITTMLAFRYFALQKVDVVVLETGLGGRLDATNVIQKPALSIITSIGLEHTRILGDTIELIALEKGGIIKKDCPVLVGPNVPHSTLQQCAQEKGASHYYTCEDVLRDDDNTNTDILMSLDNVDYDYENSCIAKAAIQLLQRSHPHIFKSSPLTEDIILRGISHRPPCRFEVVQYKSQQNNQKSMIVILDVAHNPPAMEYLSYKLHSTYPNSKFRIVVGMSSDKDMRLCSESLKQIVRNDIGRIHLVEAAHPRAAKFEDMWKADPELEQCATYDTLNRSITNQILTAINAITKNNNEDKENEILVVCGSVFLMAEAREALGFDEPRDSPYIAELAGASVRHNQENFGNRTL